MRAVHPKSVVDVGCGSGGWLAEFLAAGVEEVLGVDGDYVPRANLEIPREKFRPVDLNHPLQLDRHFDLAMSLEVAEHLSPERAKSFVADLVALAPVVLFSAAVPGQGGQGHSNEQWQDYWIACFATHGYRPNDIVRPAVWNDEAVAPWYAQNTLLYTAPDLPQLHHEPMPSRVVHPRLFLDHISAAYSRPRTLREITQELPSAARQSIRYRVSRIRRGVSR
jgi:SAM-dependent methyltransferase